jgi:hypothetical protein
VGSVNDDHLRRTLDEFIDRRRNILVARFNRGSIHDKVLPFGVAAPS